MDSKVLSDCVSWHALLVSSSCGEHVLCIGDIHFAWSYLLASFGHDQSSTSVGIQYVSVDVH